MYLILTLTYDSWNDNRLSAVIQREYRMQMTKMKLAHVAIVFIKREKQRKEPSQEWTTNADLIKLSQTWKGYNPCCVCMTLLSGISFRRYQVENDVVSHFSFSITNFCIFFFFCSFISIQFFSFHIMQRTFNLAQCKVTCLLSSNSNFPRISPYHIAKQNTL